MLINEMLKRFRPVYAVDDGGAPGGDVAAATVAAIVNADKEAPEAEAEPEYELPEDVDAGQAAEIEYIDFDLDGVKVKAPKDQEQALRDAAFRQSDYTIKTKDLAAKAKQAEETVKQYQERAAQDDTFREGVFHLKNVDADLAKRVEYFNSPEYRKLREEDPLGARNLRDDFEDDKGKRDKLYYALGQMQQERNSKAADEAKAQADANSRLREQALQKVSKEISGWNADRQAKVRAEAIARGYAPEAIDSITDPLHWSDLYYAGIGRQAVAAKARNGTGAVRPQTPGSTRTVGQGGGAATGNANAKLDKASSDDYVAMRRQQMAKG